LVIALLKLRYIALLEQDLMKWRISAPDFLECLVKRRIFTPDLGAIGNQIVDLASSGYGMVQSLLTSRSFSLELYLPSGVWSCADCS
jgi:hypothetical protein